MLARGAERYHIYCAARATTPAATARASCAAQGLPTTSLHIDRLRAVEDGYLFEVITNGRGLMPAYRWPIPPADRWAIIAHVREIQKQQPERRGDA